MAYMERPRTPALGQSYCAKRRREIIALGKCSNCCRKRAMPGKTICKGCSARHQATRQALRAQYKEAGLCSRCGAERDMPNRLQCSSCTAEGKRYRDKYADRMAPAH